MNKTNLKPLRVKDDKPKETFKPPKMGHNCPFCGMEINIELMSTKAYARHYNGECQDNYEI